MSIASSSHGGSCEMIWRSFPLLAIILLAVNAFAWDPLLDATPEKLVGGIENLQLITSAKSIQVFRIVDSKRIYSPGQTIEIDGQKCSSSDGTVGSPELDQVVAAVSDVDNFGGSLLCIFDPGVIFRFQIHDRTLDMIICFHCHEMVFYRDGAVVERPSFKFAKRKNTFRKDATLAFLAVAKKAFPKDSVIQNL